MKITVIKMNHENQVAVRAEQIVDTPEAFISFAFKLGVQEDYEQLVSDYEALSDRTYIVGL